ncbi:MULTISPECIES: DUF3272 family protein [unclassified Streptococcus]|uniref:DUF3272 family protein n=1 Tax=unclassified Streptococcus TaxID=2608887 RepID=UPI0011B797C3|nr:MULTISPECIES: DUF3272 family protein [unclassified Streptococcus]TWS95634.1 DUF3272 family protein [Streptococcus sp. sy018]TWT12383.1 DUF3272 family protein [Streptococcus sp. sy004]TWT16752.1 DUF3272 family protein [Streptococcus sp. sy010]
MTILQFLLVAFFCALETIFFNQALFNGEYLIAAFWGFLLYRDLRRVYFVTKLTESLFTFPKKKD